MNVYLVAPIDRAEVLDRVGVRRVLVSFTHKDTIKWLGDQKQQPPSAPVAKKTRTKVREN